MTKDRELACDILNAIEEKCDIELNGLMWYELEDLVTSYIKGK